MGALIGASDSQQRREVPGVRLGPVGPEKSVISFPSVIGRERERETYGRGDRPYVECRVYSCMMPSSQCQDGRVSSGHIGSIYYSTIVNPDQSILEIHYWMSDYILEIGYSLFLGVESIIPAPISRGN